MQSVGIKELKDRLSYYLTLTKQGEDVVVTDRGEPVAILHSLDRMEKDAGVEEKLAALASRGLVRLPAKKSKFKPLQKLVLKGKPLSLTIIKNRR